MAVANDISNREDIRKGEFVIEYVGEVISNHEAENRGIMYDYKKLSYLFELNSEYQIDATRMGNRSRFINHSSEGNCKSKIVLVSLEHRIEFRAIQDIASGQEIFFNYGKDYAKRYGLLNPNVSRRASENGQGRGDNWGPKKVLGHPANMADDQEEEDDDYSVPLETIHRVAEASSGEEWEDERELLNVARKSTRRATKPKRYSR